LIAGCASRAQNDSDASTKDRGATVASIPRAGAGGAANSTASARTAPVAEVPKSPAIKIPPNAKYTLFVQRIDGPTHVNTANQTRDALRRTGLSDWYVVHQKDQSLLYYGFYRAVDPDNAPGAERADARRAVDDKLKVQQVEDGRGNKLFAGSVFQPIDTPDPSAPAEWDLQLAKGTWTVQVAAFSGNAQRKEASVEAVRELRKDGFQAYFYHGPNVSSVCVGVWPATAVTQRGEVAETRDDEKTIVVSTLPIGANISQQVNSDGSLKYEVIQSGIDVKDPQIREMQRRFPHTINYELDLIQAIENSTGKLVRVPRSGIIVRIPTPGETPAVSQSRLPDATLVDPSQANRGLGARLKQLNP